jgi:exopolysaccharide production protein ExoZ
MTEKHTICGIQVLRGLAACMVVIHHSTQRFANLVPGSSTPFWENGASGVDIFFIISGFVMAISTLGREDKRHPAAVFLARRFIRLVPMYWAMTLLFITITLALQHHATDNIQVHTQITFSAVLKSLTFIPYKSSLGIQPILAVGWTLSFEVLFYLLFAAALALRVSVIGWLTPSLLLLAGLSVFRSPTWPPVTVLFDPLLLEFLAGLLLGYAVLRGYRGFLMTSSLLGLFALGFLLFAPAVTPVGLRVIVWGLPALLIVHAIVVMEPRWGKLLPRWALLLGDASYSLYLSHNMIMNIFFNLLIKLHLAGVGHNNLTYELLGATLCLFVTIAVALALYWFIEKPVTEMLKRRLVRRSEPTIAALASH